MCIQSLVFLFHIFRARSNIIYIFVLFLSEKQRIDSGYYLYQAELKSKKEKEVLKTKNVYSNLGAIFAVDQEKGSTDFSSNSDEDFDIHHTK